jgi:hypothetical protein
VLFSGAEALGQAARLLGERLISAAEHRDA